VDARKEFSVRLTAKGTTAAVLTGGLLALNSPEPAQPPHHADNHRPFIGLSPNFDIGGGTAMDPEAIVEHPYPQASASPGLDPRFRLAPGRFAGLLS
jgi:hypothetical protein